MAVTKEQRERIEDFRRHVVGLDEAGRMDLVSRLAQTMNESTEQAEAFVRRVEEGSLEGHLEEVEQRLAVLNKQLVDGERQVAHLRSLMSVYVRDDRPWMMALEMQFATMRILQWGAEVGMSDEVGRGLAFFVSSQLKRAESYAWTRETSTAALMASHTVPADSRINLAAMPGQAGWWWFAEPLSIACAADSKGACALAWSVEEGHMRFSAFALGDMGPILALNWSWSLDESWAEMKARNDAEKLLMVKPGDIDTPTGRAAIASLSRFFVAGCAWLQQRVVTVTGGHVERHRRKQLARENNGAVVQPEVKVIQLRRSESHQSDAPRDPDAAPAEWSCRWVVNGHWRNQFYGKTNEHKLIYIMPFVKGPADKPFRTAAHTVYEVSR